MNHILDSFQSFGISLNESQKQRLTKVQEDCQRIEERIKKGELRCCSVLGLVSPVEHDDSGVVFIGWQEWLDETTKNIGFRFGYCECAVPMTEKQEGNRIVNIVSERFLKYKAVRMYKDSVNSGFLESPLTSHEEAPVPPGVVPRVEDIPF